MAPMDSGSAGSWTTVDEGVGGTWEERRVEEGGFLHGLRRVGVGDTCLWVRSLAELGLLRSVGGRRVGVSDSLRLLIWLAEEHDAWRSGGACHFTH